MRDVLSLAVLIAALAALLEPWQPDALGAPNAPVVATLWSHWWFAVETLQGNPPWASTLTAHPLGEPWWHGDPLSGLLYLMLLPAGVVQAWNGLLLAQVALAALAAWFMGRDLTDGDPLAALVCALAVGASPFLLDRVGQADPQGAALLFPVLLVWSLLRDTRGLWVGIALGCTALQSPSAGAFGALLVLCLVRLRQPAETAIALGVAALLAVLPLAAALTLQELPWTLDAPPAALEVQDWLRMGERRGPVHYLGWGVLFLGAAGVAARRSLQRPGLAVFGLLALGPVLVWGGQALAPLPLKLLYATPFSHVTEPFRAASVVVPLAAGLVAVGVAKLPRALALVTPVLLVAETVVMAPVDARPLRTALEPHPIYDQLPAGSVNPLPVHEDWKRWQIFHGRPVCAAMTSVEERCEDAPHTVVHRDIALKERLRAARGDPDVQTEDAWAWSNVAP